MYKDIKLPFGFKQDQKQLLSTMKKLKSVGLHRISFGIEHGKKSLEKNFR